MHTPLSLQAMIPKIFEIDGFPHLCFLAADDIEPQQELMYDYGERNSNSRPSMAIILSSCL